VRRHPAVRGHLSHRLAQRVHFRPRRAADAVRAVRDRADFLDPTLRASAGTTGLLTA
jgi:hypothetical protein